MAGTDVATRGGRRSPLRPSWLDRIREASSAVTGTAGELVDLGATDTSPRTAAYPVECDLEIVEVLFGTPPKPARLSGTASLPAGQRDGERFPPDLLRETSFWDEAEPGTSSPVLVVFGDGPLVRKLAADDPLADDVRDVRRWIEHEASLSAVATGLGSRAAGPVAFAAGFHLLISTGADPAGAFVRFLTVPRAAEGALAGVVERLRIEAPNWEDATFGDVAEALAKGWEDERDPATLVAHITWFDAYHDRALEARPALRDVLAGLAERDESASFQGPYGPAWEGEIQRRAAALHAELG